MTKSKHDLANITISILAIFDFDFKIVTALLGLNRRDFSCVLTDLFWVQVCDLFTVATFLRFFSMLLTQSRNPVGVACLSIAWCITEVIRYSYYMMALVGDVNFVLQWAR